MRGIKIQGIAAAVPSLIEKNRDAGLILGDRRCKKQIRLTGVEQRHISGERQKMSDLCARAADDLINHLAWDRSEIRVLVLLTQNPDYRLPSTAYIIQKRLALSQNCVVFDVNLGCSAFNVGIQVAGSLLAQFGKGAKGICMQGDLVHKCIGMITNPDVLADTLLFGSAGSAVALENTGEETSILIETSSDGSRYSSIMRQFNQPIEMDGMEVYSFSTNEVVESIRRFMLKRSLVDDQIDYYVFHQAQKLILDDMADSLGINSQKELRSIRDYGNTSGASIPLSICACKDRFKEKDSLRLLTCGFGVGLSWSTSYFEINTKGILSVITCDECEERDKS